MYCVLKEPSRILLGLAHAPAVVVILITRQVVARVGRIVYVLVALVCMQQTLKDAVHVTRMQ